ncbi:MAG: hypothetical protein K2X11_21570 [Acetobacteraceae bacterium]|nr:hypothetical protein [Acetobacteraceae bacterium]
MFRCLALLGLLLTTACATVTSGTTQNITVTSEPSGAVCRLERDGATVGVVNPTPGSVNISRSTRDLTVRCEREGFQPGVRTISAGFQAMTLGNIILGGVVGIVVDAASGAVSQYEPNLHVVLPPAQLGGQARDEWFDARRREITARFDERIAAVRGSCTGRRQNDPACAQAVTALQQQRDLELRMLDDERRTGRPGGV